MQLPTGQTMGGRRAFEQGGAGISSSITFRCPECRKLLAAGRGRIGTMVICPRCQCDLKVPDSTEGGAASSSSGSHSPIEPSSGPIQVGATSEYIDPNRAAGVGGAPIFFPIQIEDDPLSLRPEAGGRTHKIPDRSHAQAPAAPPRRQEPTSSPGVDDASSSRATQVDADIPTRPPLESPDINLAQPQSIAREIAQRRHDIVLPRSAIVLWSFVMLLSLMLSFVAGLLAGHFLLPLMTG